MRKSSIKLNFIKQYFIKLIFTFLVIFVFMLEGTGCSSKIYNKYTYEFLGTFDTVIQIIGYAHDEKEFEVMALKAQRRFEELHKLYDIYNDYPGLNNVKTINDKAGVEPVAVGKDIIDIISFSIDWCNKTGGVVNIALGPVLSIWHNYRDEGLADPENARIPDMTILKAAYLKSDISKIKIDNVKNTVFLEDEGMSLDLGAVAKGYATEVVVSELILEGYDSFAISSGGNVKVAGAPNDGERIKWNIGIQNPDGNELIPDRDLLDTAFVTDTSVVSSGDYQRYYVVNDKRIHHLIEPKTLMPANYYRAVTVITKDSGVADILSTYLFLLPYDESRSMAMKLDSMTTLNSVAVLWVMPDGKVEATDNMKKVLKVMGGATNK